MPPSHLPLLDDDEIVRYVPPKLVDGEVIAPDAFLPRDRDFDSTIGKYGVSCNWLQYFPPPEESQVASVRGASRIMLKANGRFAKLQIGAARAAISVAGEVSRAVTFIRDELPAEGEYLADDSHAVITGLTSLADPEDKIILQLLVDSVTSLHPGKI